MTLEGQTNGHICSIVIYLAKNANNPYHRPSFAGKQPMKVILGPVVVYGSLIKSIDFVVNQCFNNPYRGQRSILP